MGKIRTRFIGDESMEEKQKKEQKERTARKKAEKMAEQVDKHMDAQEEGEEKAVTKETESAKAQTEQKPTKSKKIKTHGKQYLAARKKVDFEKSYELAEAIALLKKIAFAKFPESVELHVNLIEMGLKGEVELPYSTGKEIRIAIVDDAVIEKLEKGIIDFDMLITHPSFMPKIAKFARVLGPKGLMPNPKAGTVSTNPEEVAKKFQKGTLRWKSESKAPLLHQMVAKLGAKDEEIIANITALLRSIGKKNYRAVFIKSTMSPALRLSLESLE